MRKTLGFTVALSLACGSALFAQDSAAPLDATAPRSALDPARDYGPVQTKQYDDGSVYVGTFVDGVQEGTGTYTLPSGYEYSGEWVKGEIKGLGRARYPNGSIYVGAFSEGKPQGRGKITFGDGGSYEGIWQNGKMTGEGEARYANGAVYRGGFKDGVHDGKGVMGGSMARVLRSMPMA